MAGHAEYWGANFHVRVGPSLCPLRENAAASNCEKNCKCRGFSNVTIFKDLKTLTLTNPERGRDVE